MKIGKRRLVLLILAVIFSLSFVLRLWPMETSKYWDECVYLQHSEIIFSGRDNYSEMFLRPPMLPVMIALLYIFWHNLLVANIMEAFIGALGTVLAYLLGKEFYNERVGLLAAILFGLSPYLVYASNHIWSDVPSLVFLMASFYALKKAEKNRVLYLASGILFSFSVLTRFTSLFIGPVFLLYFYLKKIKFGEIKHWFLGSIASILPYLAWVQINYGFFLETFIRAGSLTADKSDTTFLYITGLVEIYPLVTLVGLVIFLMFFLKKMKQRSDTDLLMISWIIFFIALMYTIRHREPRYLIPVAFPVCILAARGYDLLLERGSKPLRTSVILVLIILASVSFAQSFQRLGYPFLNFYDTQEVKVSKYINSIEGKDDYMIYSNENYPVYAYYTERKVTFLENQDEYFYKVFPENMKMKGFYLYYRNLGQHPNEEWMDLSDRFTKIETVENVTVYEYNP